MSETFSAPKFLPGLVSGVIRSPPVGGGG